MEHKIQRQMVPELVQYLTEVSKELSSFHLLSSWACWLLSFTVSAWGPKMTPALLESYPSSVFTSRKEGRREASFHKPFLMGFSPIVKVGNISQKPLANITCLDRMMTLHYKRVWESTDLAKRTGSDPCEREQTSVNICRAQGKSTNYNNKWSMPSSPTLTDKSSQPPGRPGLNLESLDSSEFHARMWSHAQYLFSFSSYPQLHLVPHGASNTGM